MQSAFFAPGAATEENHLALLHLSRDQSLPVLLSQSIINAQGDGYAEGVVTNTKFGSFPHTTLLDVPWGSQVRASKVDTGSRGRPSAKKRKAEAISTNSPNVDVSSPVTREAPTASSGFVHVLPPTPENWTTSLPHRTQVVYTPDYSYILHRIRARPGSVILEAGSGSGSFTHAAARAIFDGASDSCEKAVEGSDYSSTARHGKVYSYEFHPVRHEKVKIEMEQHGLTPIVEATHRDVYKDGFLLRNVSGQARSPVANAIFLDLPAPWMALPHLSREDSEIAPSALNPDIPVYICTFSPCIEQAQKTISAMRRSGWIEIEMVEMQHKRIDVRREYTGLKYDGMRSVNAVAFDVDEAVTKLREIDQRASEFQRPTKTTAKQVRVSNSQNKQQAASNLLFKEGKIIHRSEPDLKTHTSYLVFAILPREWSDNDEVAVQAEVGERILAVPKAAKSQRQLKKEAKLRKKIAKGAKEVNGDA